MDLFRRKQKLIFWIVTIIIVPSFVLVWGYNRSMHGESVDFEVGKINGESVKYPEFEAFRKRIQAAIGGVPLQFAGIPGAGSESEELWKYVFTYTLLKDAEKSGARVPDLQVGTYLENAHPILRDARRADDPNAMDRAVESLCRQMQISRQEFLRGVREWQAIGNYLIADANLAAVSDDTVFSFYSLNRAECVVKRVRVAETDEIRERAKKEITEKPKDELEKLARDYAAAHSNETAYREPARWRFAYVLTPFVSEASIRQPGEDEIAAEYERAKQAGSPFKNLDEARPEIKASLVRQEIDSQTLRNLTVDVDPQLRGQGLELALPELVKLTQLAKYGVTAGDTGPADLGAADLMAKLPAGASPTLRMLLDSIDNAAPAERDAYLNEWKSGYNVTGAPFRSDLGLFRLRLLDFKPSAPAPIDNPDGGIRPEIYEQALTDMVGARAEEIVTDMARNAADKIRAQMDGAKAGAAADAGDAAEFAALPEETIPYMQIAPEDEELVRLTVGDLIGPRPWRNLETGAVGQELVVLVNRRLPTRAVFDAEPNEIKALFRNRTYGFFRGNFGFEYTRAGVAAVIQPSPTVMGGLMDRLNRGVISVNPAMLPGAARNG